MSASLRIDPNARVLLPIGNFRYKQRIGDDRHWLLSEHDGQDLILTEDDFTKFYSDKAVTIGGKKPLNSYDKSGTVEPGIELDPYTKGRAWFCRCYDRNPVPLSDKSLGRFIRENSGAARAAGCDWIPSEGALRRALKARGEQDYRPSKVMLSLSGLTSRKRFPTNVEKMIRECVAWFWAESGRGKYEAYAQLDGLIRQANETGKQQFGDTWQALPVPSFETVRTRINQMECHTTWLEKYSRRRANLRFKGTAPTLKADRILGCVAIDSTEVDNWCVMKGDDGIPLGRPTLTLAVDVYSRQIIAWTLSYEPPSLYTVMAVLEKIVTPNKYGVWGKPDTIVVDNGWEFISPSFQESCDSAGINLEVSPIKTPEYKAIVERAFLTLKHLVFDKTLGGAVPFPPHIMSKFDLDPSKTATISVDELDELLEYGIREVYAKRVHQGIQYAPQLAWDKSFQAHGRQVVNDLGALVAHFGKFETVTLTRQGVRSTDGILFADREKVSQLLDDLARDTPIQPRRKGSATTKVKLIINPANITQAAVWNPKRKQAIFLPNVDEFFAKECKTLWEFRVAKKWAAAENLAFQSDDERLAAIRSLRAMIEDVAPTLKMAAMKRARRLLEPPKRGLFGDSVQEGTAVATWQGMGPSDIATRIAAHTQEDHIPAKGVRRGGKAATQKAVRTRAENVAQLQAEQKADEQAMQATRKIENKVFRKIAEPLDDAEIDDVKSFDWVTGEITDKDNTDE